MNLISYPIIRLTALIMFIHLSAIRLESQCNPVGQLPTLQCADAPLICLTNACYSTLNEPFFCCQGWCGNNTVINNPQYFQFITTAGTVEIDIHVDNCSGGTGLQAAIVSTCDWLPCPGNNVPCNDILACNPGTNPGGTMVLISNGMTVGQAYWLLIDGSNGATCDYTINYVEGVFGPQIDAEIMMGEAIPPEVCQGFDNLILTAGPPITDAAGYLWHLGWNNNVITSTLPISYYNISDNAPPGIWDICVQAFNGCDTSDIPFCFQLEIDTLNDIEKTPATFCQEDFPLEWNGINIPGPGTYSQTFNNEFGCPYDSIWMVDAYPEVPVGSLNIQFCVNENFDPFIYEGIAYFQSGNYPLMYPGLSFNGCDSFAELNLTMDGLKLFVELICFEGQNYLIPHPIPFIPNNDTITYEWYDCDFSQIISTENILSISTPGCFCLVAEKGFCRDTFCSNYLLNPCEGSCSIVQEQACRFENVIFGYNGNASSNATFHWLIDLPGQSGVYFTGNDTIFLEYDTTGCFHASLTVVNDTTTFTCVDSVCIISGEARASICCDSVICGGCATLMFDLTGGIPWTIVISDGNTLDTISGIVTSPYSYIVCPNVSTTYSIVEVFGFEDQCPGEITGEGKATIEFHIPTAPNLTRTDTSLCGPPGMVSYSWHECDSSLILSSSECLFSPATGCYCVDVISLDGCMTTGCSDFINGIIPIKNNFNTAIFPNPTNGTLQVHLSEIIALPVKWIIYDPEGRECQNGIINSTEASLHLSGISSGLYFLKFMTLSGESGIYKLIFTTD